MPIKSTVRGWEERLGLVIVLGLFTCSSLLGANEGLFAGGTGEPNDPYRIATREQLLSIGSDPNLLNKCYILTADIDLDPNLPGGRVFDRAVIAPDVPAVAPLEPNEPSDPNEPAEVNEPGRRGVRSVLLSTNAVVSLADETDVNELNYKQLRPNGYRFSGVLDGKGHTIANLTIRGDSFLGLIGVLCTGGWIKNLAVTDVSIEGTGGYIGGLLGVNCLGLVSGCSSTGSVQGRAIVGGLIGSNTSQGFDSYFACRTFDKDVLCEWFNGPLSIGVIRDCYSIAEVRAKSWVGGLLGINTVAVSGCYSAGSVYGHDYVGGLIGKGVDGWPRVDDSFWDVEASGQISSAGGQGLTSVAMQDRQTYLDAGWDLYGDSQDGLHETWHIPEEGGYPLLSVSMPGLALVSLVGEGTPASPYLISSPNELAALIYHNTHACYRLTNDIDLEGIGWTRAVIPEFGGCFDGNNFAIRNLTVSGGYALGLFGGLWSDSQVRNLGVTNVNIVWITLSPEVNYDRDGRYIGALAGINSGTLSNCYCTGSLVGVSIGGLVGINKGELTDCHSNTSVEGKDDSGGLCASNDGHIERCHSTGSTTGWSSIGGLVGYNGGEIACSYSIASVAGELKIGGLVGINYGFVRDCYSLGTVCGEGETSSAIGGMIGQQATYGSALSRCYSTGRVTGAECVGGLVGKIFRESQVEACFWDVESSGISESAAGLGLPTIEMQAIETYLDAGWDLLGESDNGQEDIWLIPEADYPRLVWE